jgi:succinoglycan biosynthesis protein ExoL
MQLPRGADGARRVKGMLTGLRGAHGLQAYSRMTRIAFFAHDAADAAVRRRIQGFRDDGLDVVGFTMRRRDDISPEWENIDLGRTFDGAYVQRIKSIFRGARLAAAQRDLLATADVIYARNLDMLATAFLAKRYASLKTPVIYEALDVHRLLTRKDLIGLAFRRMEGALLRRTRRLVVSSPGFLENHFERRHRGRYVASLIENRLAAGAEYGERPSADVHAPEPLRIGWIGVLRCKRSLDLLTGLARAFGPAIQIDLHGAPALTEIPDFHAQIQGIPNLTYHGRYRSPEDLGRIYSALHVVWAGDFMEAGFNSDWLLPNRLYEGGYFGVPAIAPSGTQTAKWIEARGTGFTVDEDLARNLPDLVRRLLQDPGLIAPRRQRLLELPVDVFVARRGELAGLIGDTLRNTGADPDLNMHQFNTRSRRDATG